MSELVIDRDPRFRARAPAATTPGYHPSAVARRP